MTNVVNIMSIKSDSIIQCYYYSILLLLFNINYRIYLVIYFMLIFLLVFLDNLKYAVPAYASVFLVTQNTFKK